MTNRTRSATLLGAACLVAVAGCSSDPEPKVLPSLSSTPAATTAPTTSPGSVEAEVEAAVRHYFDVANAALATGNTAALKQSSLPTCACRALAKHIESDWQEGTVRGARVHLEAVHVHDVRGATAGAEVRFRVTPYVRLSSDGKELEHSAGGSVHDDLSLQRITGKWLLVDAVSLT